MQKKRYGFGLFFGLLRICFLLFIGSACVVLTGCEENSNKTKATNELAKLPKIGDMVTTERALELCVQYKLNYLEERIEENSGDFKIWKFDGCSMTPTEVLSKAIKVPSLTEICLRHDLRYAYGDPGNEDERLMVDQQFWFDLLDAGASEFVAKTMYNAVREGGKEKYCTSFSWSFARVGSCTRGSGFKLKIEQKNLGNLISH